MRQGEDYFSQIDSERKAYWLGMLYADGYNSSKTSFHTSAKGRSVELQLQTQDKPLLEDFLKDIPFGKIKRYNNESYRLVFNSKRLSEDLSNLGCVRPKSDKISFPNTSIIPEEYISHFIRGYFDGDGCVWSGKRKEMEVKDPNKKSGYRTRIIHNVKFTITSNSTFIKELQNFLISNLNFSRTKINTSKSKSFVTLEYSGRGQLRKFYNFIYNDASVFLKRKKDKFDEILNFCANS